MQLENLKKGKEKNNNRFGNNLYIKNIFPIKLIFYRLFLILHNYIFNSAFFILRGKSYYQNVESIIVFKWKKFKSD